MDRHAVIVMSLVLGIGGTGVTGLIALDPRTSEVAPEDIPNLPRPRPNQKKAKTDPKAKPPAANPKTQVLEMAPPPRQAKPALTLQEKKAASQQGCKRLSDAIAAYVASSLNPDHKLPGQQLDLFQPPFGGRPFLENREAVLNDPWGLPYQFLQSLRADGTYYILVLTLAPDGTPITQFGIGDEARPKE